MFRGAGDRPLEPKALRMCRGLLGALQCPRWGAVCHSYKVKLHIPRLRQLMAQQSSWLPLTIWCLCVSQTLPGLRA